MLHNYTAMILPNIHRFKEGARVLEDLARFVLKDESLFIKIKAIKHLAVYPDIHLSADPDVGGVDFKEPPRAACLLALAQANALRMQEAARVLEEVYDKDLYKQLRFNTYDIHRAMVIKIQSYMQLSKLRGIYALCDPSVYPIDQFVSVIFNNDIQLYQLRMKAGSKRDIIAAAKHLKAQLPDRLLIVNDHLDIALAYADGVHLGQTDLPIATARKIAPLKFIIGATCRSVAEAEQAIQDGASYLGVGSVFSTNTKQDAELIRMEIFEEIIKISSIPICAIGGINSSNIEQIREMGVEMFAMAEGLNLSP